MIQAKTLFSPAVRFALHKQLFEFVHNPWRDLVLVPDNNTNLHTPPKYRFTPELVFFVEGLVDDYDYSATELNVGRVFWAIEESACVSKLAALLIGILRRTDRNLHSDPSVFLNAAEWPEIELLAREALSMLEKGDREHANDIIA